MPPCNNAFPRCKPASPQSFLYTRATSPHLYTFGDSMIEVTEVSIAELRAALEAGRTTAVELVKAYLDRSERETQGCLSQAVKQLDATHSAKVIWLKDKAPRRDTGKVRSVQAK